jgi:uncharacterized protein involved in outer membrane biogenesis
MKKLLLGALAFVVIVIAGLAIAVRMLIDPERVRATIESQASAALGLPVTLQAAEVSVWPRARVTLNGLTVGQPASLTLETIEVATAIRALLSRRIENAELTLADSTVDLPALLAALDRVAAPPAPPPDSLPTDAPLTLVSVDAIAFRNVRVNFEKGAATVSLESALNGDRLDIRSFELASPVTTLTAAGSIESLASRKGKISIDAESLDLDGMVALLAGAQGARGAQGAQGAKGAQGAQGAGAQGAGAQSAPFDLVFDVTAAKGRAGGVQFDNLKTTIRATADAVLMEPFGLGVFGGRVDGKAHVDATRAEPRLTVDVSLNGIDMSAVTAFAGQPDAMTGRLGGQLRISGSGREPAAALAGATGRGALKVTDGVIPNLHLVRTIVLAFGKPAQDTSGSGDRFSSLAATMQLENSVVRFTDLSFASADVDLAASGTLRLEGGAIDVAGRAMLSEALTAQAGRDLVRYTAENKRVTVPVTVRGPISAPKVGVDTGNLLQRAAENEMKRELQKRTGGLLDRLTGKKKP